MPADLRGLTASLDATFGADSRVTALAVTPGLELRGPFYEHGSLPIYLLRNVTAGVFAGDEYHVRLRSDPGSSVKVASTAATKVHSMTGREASIQMSIEAATGSCIFYAPAPTILQAGSNYCQTTSIRVAAGATAIVREVVAFGRLARGERLAFRRFANELTITLDGALRPAFAERFVIVPGEDRGDINELLQGSGAIGTLIAVGVDAELLVRTIRRTLSDDACQSGVSILSDSTGLVIKTLANRIDSVLRLMRDVESVISESAGPWPSVRAP